MARSQGKPAPKGKTKVKREQVPAPPPRRGAGGERSLLSNPTVFIFKTAAGYRVRPAYVAAPGGGAFHIKNLTGSDIQVLVPGEWFADNATVTIADGGLETVDLATPPEVVRQPYAVYVVDPAVFADGESHPEVIIEP